MCPATPVRFLIGSRLYLRPLEAADGPRSQVWINDPDIRRTILMQRPMSRLAEDEWLKSHDQSMTPKDVIFAIVLSEGDRHIGNTSFNSIDWINRVAETGTLIGEKDCWGMGYATEAKELLLEYGFNTLGLNRIESHTIAFNVASMRHLEKTGYIEEGRFRDRMFRDGKWHDTVHFGILRQEWLERHAHVSDRKNHPNEQQSGEARDN